MPLLTSLYLLSPNNYAHRTDGGCLMAGTAGLTQVYTAGSTITVPLMGSEEMQPTLQLFTTAYKAVNSTFTMPYTVMSSSGAETAIQAKAGDNKYGIAVVKTQGELTSRLAFNGDCMRDEAHGVDFGRTRP